MSSIVLDANILIRAVLGNKVQQLLITHSQSVDFFTPDICMEDAQKYLPAIFEKRGISSESSLIVLSQLKPLLQIVDTNFYKEYAQEVKQRIKSRDIPDWPVIATTMMLTFIAKQDSLAIIGNIFNNKST